MNTLKTKSIDAIIWNLIERYGIQIFSLFIGIILARLLSPSDYGLIGMMGVFFTVAMVFVDSGFGSAYIQKQDANEIDASSVFFFNLLASILLYIILWFLSPYIAKFYHQEQLINLLRVSSVVLIVNAFRLMQVAKLKKEVNFKKKSSSVFSKCNNIRNSWYKYGAITLWSLELNELLQEQDCVVEKQNEIIICPRTYSHKPEYEKHIDELIVFAKHLEKSDYKTHWVFLQKDKEQLMSKLDKFKVTIWNPFEMSISDFISLFRSAVVTYTSRMHSVFISGMVKTPFVAIPLHQKLEFASQLFYKSPFLINPLSKQEKYLESFNNLKNDFFSTEKLSNEISILKELDKEVNNWLIS